MYVVYVWVCNIWSENNIFGLLCILTQFIKFLSSSFVLLYNCATSCDEKLGVVPSAKLNIFKDVELLMSFTYTRNRIGPKIDPCGTPLII